MDKNEHDPHQHDGNEHNAIHPTRPYWKRMHYDWRFWVGGFLILVAITYYVMSNNFAFAPPTQPDKQMEDKRVP